jgi:hypothetical protein
MIVQPPKKSRVPIWILQVLHRSDVMAQEARSRESEAEWAPQNTLMRDLSENRVPLDVLINCHILSSSLKLQLFRYSMVYPFSLPGQKLEDTSSKTGAIDPVDPIFERIYWKQLLIHILFSK